MHRPEGVFQNGFWVRVSLIGCKPGRFGVLIRCLSAAPPGEVFGHMSWKGLRAETQHVAIRIFHVKLERPTEIREGHANWDAACD